MGTVIVSPSITSLACLSSGAEAVVSPNAILETQDLTTCCTWDVNTLRPLGITFACRSPLLVMISDTTQHLWVSAFMFSHPCVDALLLVPATCFALKSLLLMRTLCAFRCGEGSLSFRLWQPTASACKQLIHDNASFLWSALLGVPQILDAGECGQLCLRWQSPSLLSLQAWCLSMQFR